jgi:hypothetical protein
MWAKVALVSTLLVVGAAAIIVPSVYFGLAGKDFSFILSKKT